MDCFAEDVHIATSEGLFEFLHNVDRATPPPSLEELKEVWKQHVKVVQGPAATRMMGNPAVGGAASTAMVATDGIGRVVTSRVCVVLPDSLK